MKKKEKAILKKSKKETKQNLKNAIVVELNKIAENLGPVSKKAAKVIDKTANQTAKKLAKLVKPVQVEEVAPIAAS